MQSEVLNVEKSLAYAAIIIANVVVVVVRHVTNVVMLQLRHCTCIALQAICSLQATVAKDGEFYLQCVGDPHSEAARC